MRRGVSAPAYFTAVAVLTALLLGGALALRPSFAHSVRDTFGLGDTPRATADSFYATRVAPLFDARCGGCHGAKRQKSGLRIDSFAAAMRGGKHGPVIRAGDARRSELLARIALPQTDERAMPPQGKEPLSADDATLIRLWVAAGASPTLRAADIPGAPPPARVIRVPDLDVAAAERARAPLAAPLAALQARYPSAIAYASRGSADLEINASLAGTAFGDADVAALAPLRERIVRLDLSGTRVTDASAVHLAAMNHLQVLRVIDAKLTAQSLAPLRARGVRILDGRD